jgi:hypothetical protein
MVPRERQPYALWAQIKFLDGSRVGSYATRSVEARWWPIAQVALECAVAWLGCSRAIGVVRRGGRPRRAATMRRAADVGLRFQTALWPVVPLGGWLARVVRPLPRLQFVDGVADEVSNAEAEWAFATCGQLLKVWSSRRPGRLRPAHGRWHLPCGWRVLGRRAWQGAASCEGGRLAAWCRLARSNSGLDRGCFRNGA